MNALDLQSRVGAVVLGAIGTWGMFRIFVGVRKGEMRLRYGPISKTSEPKQFWFMVCLIAGTCVLFLAIFLVTLAQHVSGLLGYSLVF